MELITCNCKVCKINKGPLSANVPSTLLDQLGRDRKTVHGLVYSANDPSFVGRVTRDRLKITAA